MPELGCFRVLKLGILFEEQRKLEDYLESVLRRGVVMVKESFDGLVVLKDGVILELYLKLKPAHAQQMLG